MDARLLAAWLIGLKHVLGLVGRFSGSLFTISNQEVLIPTKLRAILTYSRCGRRQPNVSYDVKHKFEEPNGKPCKGVQELKKLWRDLVRQSAKGPKLKV